MMTKPVPAAFIADLAAAAEGTAGINVAPPHEPLLPHRQFQPALPRFLCDEMLGSLCRYLRAAGYDTLLARNGASDAELLRQCHADSRHFVTRDTLVREHKAARDIALTLPHAPLDRLAVLLGARFDLDWLGHAFTSCLMDNTPLAAADEAALARVPPDARHPDEPLRCCPTCGRVYWRGSHYKRMRARLNAWQQARGMRERSA